MNSAKKRVVVFISGGGSNMVSLADACAEPGFPAEIVAVISDKPTAGGLAKAEARGIRTYVFERKAYAGKAEHENAILETLADINPDIICLAGYMRLISGDFIRPYEGRILNIHPSLLPLFPGLHTHQRAIDAGMKIAGCTVHFVTEGMDEGPIVAQAAVPVITDDTADMLAGRVLTVEHELYPMALKLLAEGKVRMERGRAEFTPADDAAIADQRIVSAGL
ncbi:MULTISPECIES: phosphoribosylglycinamide formyltransferase [Rhizobiaceae]|jgi:phosphoribosylglycinamide formyltransferase-1|uniref:Phosphoribosylglycinamide formyltransferase n=1 Tax=Aliirhizobium cellulosilyticum TaxID=393664 RepID=A0A7W6SB01_9HYPH|nr:phosphoribosylglycinamide formyltransferase [Rhizobium cellulosilyticum]MBB4350436.1 phosphoribosylglycinamide formyltransferase-1 [Rhizobium cellulosilyticum]MBB4413532.1 phosphoribosylglycinamide formyltransferase-1 [Rhizobium cellulosilyticum]MBB4448165.1 phosphoribosylglycinamide formyltransferase-1 [Rhizobium cellulosilyticum]